MKILRKRPASRAGGETAVKARLSRIGRGNRSEVLESALSSQDDVLHGSLSASHSGAWELDQEVRVQRQHHEQTSHGAHTSTVVSNAAPVFAMENQNGSVHKAETSVDARASTPSSRQDAAEAKSAAEPEAAASKSTLAPLDIVVPSRIGNYVIGERLGSGTCGVVHCALDTVLQREVAIKLSPVGEVNVSTGKVPGAQRAYQTEVYAAGRLHHPNIVTVYDAGQHEDLNFLVMEMIEGDSLKKFGKGQTLLPTWRALQIICECCKALDYSHRQGILHRDIKPANVMVSTQGVVKLLDFGIAVGLTEDGGLSRSGPTLGTPNYMSPEQILGKELTPSSDFYSLGTVLFEMLSGKQLFKAEKVKDLFRTVVHKPAPRLSEFRPDLPQALSDVLEKALQKKPELRFQSGIELIDALQHFVEQFKVIEELDHTRRGLLDTLQPLSFFAGFNQVDIAQLLREAELMNVRQGMQLLPDGNLERELIILLDGAVRVEGDQGNYVGVFGPGDCIGEAGFIHGNRVDQTFTVLEDMQVLVVTDVTLSSLPSRLHLEYYKRCADILLTRMEDEHLDGTPDITL